MSKKTTKELIAAYNAAAKKLGEKPVKRFANRATAEKRTAAIVARAKGSGSKAPTKAKKNGATRSSAPLDLKPRKGDVITPREGSLGEKAIKALAKGATRETLAKIIGGENASGRVRTLLNRLNSHNGYGIRQTGDTFKLVR